MKKIKKISLMIGLCFGSFIVGCSTVEVIATQNNPLKIWFQNENGEMSTYNVVDATTGVNYVVVKTRSTGGYQSASICPRYKADGTLYVD